jgi:branched-chain amino acid transport system substrate-binding protein
LYGSEALGDLNFTMSMWNTTMGAAGAEFAYNVKGWETAYVMTDTTIEYDTSLADYFIETFEHLGGTVLAEDEFLQEDPDIAALIQRFQEVEDEVDVLFIASYMPGVAAAIRQVRSAGIETPLMGGDSWDTAELYGALGPEIGNNLWIVTHSWTGADSPDPKMAPFREEYEKDYGEPPTLAYHAMGWDSVMAVAQAIEAAGSTNGKEVALALEEEEFDLLSGSLDYTTAEEGHYPLKEAFIINVEANEPSFVDRTLPSWLPEP